jgi:hypothetical protein
LHAAGVTLLVPLVSRGELLGLLALGPRRSGQDYSSDDRALGVTMVTTSPHAAPSDARRLAPC